MASGVKINPQVIETFSDFKLRKNYRFILMGIGNSNKEIVILRCSERHATYQNLLDEFKSAMDAGEGRYAIYDNEYTLASGAERSKLVFISWVPDNLPVKQRMLYASSKNDLKKKLVGLAKEIQATSMDEVSEQELMAVCMQGERE